MKKVYKTLLTTIFAGSLTLPLLKIAHANTRDTLNYGNEGIPRLADPQQMNETSTHIISVNVFEGLTVLDDKGKIAPGLATSWESKDNATRFIFHLRKNLKWSDGSTLNIDDVIFSFQHLLDPKTSAKFAHLMYPIKNAVEVASGKKPLSSLAVKKLNSTTVEFRLINPTPFFPGLLAGPTGNIIPKSRVLKYGQYWAKPEHIISNGAYKINTWIPNGVLTLKANPYYYDAKNVHIKNIKVTSADTLEPLINLFITKKLDMVDNSLEDKRSLIQAKRPDTIHTYNFPGVYFLPINMNDPLLGGSKNTDIRQALAMAINRKGFLKVTHSQANPSHTFVPEGIEGISHAVFPYWDKWSFAKRVNEAKKIMMKHGYTKKHPLSLKIDTKNTSDSRKKLVAIIRYWKRIGVNAKLDVYEGHTHTARLRGKQFQVTYTGWVLDYNDAYDFLFLHNLKSGGTNDYSGYNNPIFNKYFNSANKEGDPKKRGDLFVKAETQLLKDMPSIPLSYSSSTNLISKHISGFVDNVMNIHPLKYLQFK